VSKEDINTPRSKRKSKEIQKDFNNKYHNNQTTWDSIARNYEMIQGAHITNSFILLMALAEAIEPLSTTQISEIISRQSRGQIFKLSATLKDSLEYRLRRAGYVEGLNLSNKTLYSITPKGKKLLKGWIAFVLAYRQTENV
jgi:hypothetical protein